MYSGVLAGMAYDGSAAYVGGIDVTCNSAHFGVARISASLTNAGAFYACNSSTPGESAHNASSTIISSLNYHPNMKWKPVITGTLSTASMCTYVSGGNTYGAGRYVTPDGYTIIGEVEMQIIFLF